MDISRVLRNLILKTGYCSMCIFPCILTAADYLCRRGLSLLLYISKTKMAAATRASSTWSKKEAQNAGCHMCNARLESNRADAAFHCSSQKPKMHRCRSVFCSVPQEAITAWKSASCNYVFFYFPPPLFFGAAL